MKEKFTRTLLSLAFSFGQIIAFGQWGFGFPFEELVDSQAKEVANQLGEKFEYIYYNDFRKGTILKGTLRILKLDNRLNYIEIGQWTYQGSFPDFIGIRKIKSRDTTFFDSLGNALRKRYYHSKKNDNYELTEAWTSEISQGRFLLHLIEYFGNGKIKKEFTMRVVDYDIPKADIDRNKIRVGTTTKYKRNGHMKKEETYNNDGKIISEKKY